MKAHSAYRLLAALGGAMLLAACTPAIKPAAAARPQTTTPANTLATSVAPAAGYAARSDVQAFISRLVVQDGLPRAWLNENLGAAVRQDSVLQAIARPYEAKPWYEYEPLFVNQARIEAGVTFWNAHASELAQAEQRYGVPPDMIVAILGVESFYGRQKGGYSVLNALSTLAFDYPPRATFFQNELAQYLLMCHEQGLDPAKLTGSYAGAMGAPQFMPDSYRQYAVATDGSSPPDIWNDWSDIIASVANYFALHGWQRDGLVAVPAALPEVIAEPPATLTPTTTGALHKAGVVFDADLAGNTPAILVALQLQQGTEYWLGLDNFRVIMKYNKSPLYAMAVYDLATRIQETRSAAAGDATR